MTKRVASDADTPSKAITRTIVELVSAVPTTTEPRSATPQERARALTLSAALRTATVSGTLALPPGPLGVVTILPDLLAVWKIQSQLVADVAAAFGKTGALGQEQMLYCLFRHAAAQAFRDVVMRVGERVLVRRASLKIIQTIASKLGVKITQRVVATSVARWLPVVGATGVAAYAYFDTSHVGATAQDFFSRAIDLSESEAPRDAQ